MDINMGKNAKEEIAKEAICEICGKNSKEKHKLKRHMMVHTGEKPFSCSYCHKSFALDYNLNTHMRIHTGEKPFKCTYANCGKSFTQSGNLKTHLKTNHNNIEPPEVIVKKEESARPFHSPSFDSIICKALSKL